jgi:hypothetical protein
MPRILNPDGSSRFVDFLNPGDQLSSGGPSVLDATGKIAGEQGPGGTVAQVLNPGADEGAQIASAVSTNFRIRRTSQPSLPSLQSDQPASSVRLRPGGLSSTMPIPGQQQTALEKLEDRLAGVGTPLDKLEKKLAGL